MNKYDVIVIGAGHAGIEAANSAAGLGVGVLLLTLDIDAVGRLSCNPAVGGIAKGHLVREADALGGLIAKITDRAALGYRILNRSKGKAVWATRAQVDSLIYPKIARDILENNSNIEILQAKVRNILVKNNKVRGVELNFGQIVESKAVIICAGTFLKSTIHIGMENFSGGRLYEESSDSLFNSIKKLGFKTRHFKTGTCARLDKRSIDFSKMAEQSPDEDAGPFSFWTPKTADNQLSCYITYTNSKTHKIILRNLKHSPLYSGKIKARGVRYCPSLEDKVVRFSDKERHQIFIEPQARDSVEVYPNGVSTSLPFEVQLKFIRSIEGLEKALILRPGYGIEHGLIDARQLYPTLEAQKISGLFFAGQVNGTTGYEEAAAQGLIAGINAALGIKKKKPFILSRQSSFIGVLIDDLTSKGTDEPYRMFTSRSEFSLSLRESNADIRLMPLGFELGLIDKQSLAAVLEKKNSISEGINELKNKKMIYKGEKVSLYNILKRPRVSYQGVSAYLDKNSLSDSAQREVEIEIKYEGFIRRQLVWMRELKNLDKIKIPKIDFSKVPSLSKEVVEKLIKFKPATLGQALKISGITPAAILAVYNFIKRAPRLKNHR